MMFDHGKFADRDWQTEDPGGTVRFAMIGIGWWTRDQAVPAVADADFCETTVLVSGDKEKARSNVDLAESIERGITYDEFHDGVASDLCDAVYIVTPNALHLPFVETAAELGKDVLCEKPMEATVDRAQEIVRLAADSPVSVMIAYRMQTEPAVRRARELIQDGVIGTPVHVHGNMSQQLLEMISDPDQWRLDDSLSGGATVMDIGLYPINTTRFVLDADPVGVQAATTYDHEAFDDVEDEHTAFILRFPDGVYVTCTASQNAYQSSHLRITGTEGEIEIDPAFFDRKPRGFKLSMGDESYEVDFERVNQMREEFDYFSHQVLTGQDLYPDAAHGLVDMEIMEGIYEAAERESLVEL